MRKIYYFIFYCFYSILQTKDTEKTEGATSLITILLVSITFSVYFLSHIWFDLEFYYPLVEIFAVVVICLIIWYLNRNYFIKHNQASNAIRLNQGKNKVLCKILGIFLTIGQFTLFIVSGIITSKHVWEW